MVQNMILIISENLSTYLVPHNKNETIPIHLNESMKLVHLTKTHNQHKITSQTNQDKN